MWPGRCGFGARDARGLNQLYDHLSFHRMILIKLTLGNQPRGRNSNFDESKGRRQKESSKEEGLVYVAKHKPGRKEGIRLGGR